MLRLLLAFIAYRNYTTVQMELTNAYLHVAIKEVVFIVIPDGFPGAGEIALLEKGLYGTKQGSRIFYDHTDEIFKSIIGLKPCPNEPCLYRNLNEHGACFVLLYVDDALITGDKETVTSVEHKISKHFNQVQVQPTIPGVTSISMTTFTTKMIKTLSVTPWPYPILKHPAEKTLKSSEGKIWKAMKLTAPRSAALTGLPWVFAWIWYLPQRSCHAFSLNLQKKQIKF
jgi:hypothetical protein